MSVSFPYQYSKEDRYGKAAISVTTQLKSKKRSKKDLTGFLCKILNFISLQRLFIFHRSGDLTARKEDFLGKQATALCPTLSNTIVPI
jgi:hypothetical protein